MIKSAKRSGTKWEVNAFCEVRNSAIHGRGVFATRSIKEGVKIVEYVGEKIDKEESNRRGLELFEKSQKTGGAAVYIFDLNDDFDLDGDKPYNDAKYINHSCDPNSEMINEDDELWLYATKNIKKGEEITFDYGYDLEHFMDHPCRCGKDNCVGYIVATSDRPKLKKILTKSKKKKSKSKKSKK